MAKDTYEPELVVKEGQRPFYLSDDGHGTPIAWDQCHAMSGGCGKALMDCDCKGGPKEPFYITRWRVEAQGGVFERAKTLATSVGRALSTSKPKRSTSPDAPTGMSMSSFIDADVIAKVKAAKEEQRDQE